MKFKEIFQTIKEDGMDKFYFSITENIPKRKKAILDGIVIGMDIFPTWMEIFCSDNRRTIGSVAVKRAHEEGYLETSYIASLVTWLLSSFTLWSPQLLFVGLEGGRVAYRNFKEKIYER